MARSSTELDVLPAVSSGKEYHNMSSRELSAGTDDDLHEQKGITRHDQADMSRMGKVQELRRNYRPLSAIAFTVILQGTWEVLMTATTQGLVDGGLAGLIWSYVWTFAGFSFVMASLAEMASMAPTSGGQYHWVSEFAPAKYQRFLSYFTGWMSTMSWQAGTASGPFLVGTLIQGCAIVAYPDYSPTNYQGTLMVIAVAIIVWIFNVYGAHAMPILQNLMLIVHVLGFLTIIIVLWVLSPRNTAETVFTVFTNDGGWNSMGLSLMVGQISAIYACICSDAAAHMSEEIKDAGVVVPRAMVWSYVINGGLGFIFLVTYLFMITDVEAALEDWYPHIWVFRQAVNDAGVVGLNVIPTVLIFAGTVSYNLSTSRQTWSFARDKGVPFSNWIAKVDPKLEVPINSVTVTTLITIALSLINIGSDVAFNAIISLNVVSLMITYMTSIGCVLWRRIYHPETLPTCRWSLGKWGVPVNICGFLYSTHAFFWCFWPNATPTDAENFNWASVMFVAVFILSSIYYVFKGRKAYEGPVVLTEGWKGE
ncbi:Choline transport protein [Lasiodiplodia hormozganensis]|uniref:Choline transport protein n=2 Tax=Lasiodiplodia TaxID=66739 RepID=A0A5N5D2K0_9PEZI|nr:Gaba permease [Lasiodiplodia theobromae]KAB2571876.1 Choline transport protein [Lasiodiplodia theobromae]KAF4539015.1 Gaba permease [Lasiodiplodia theobromae]KAK0654151.1 Choline transport protein [Lasiodiplodia hormozganensis]